jgi:hypothetical protein
MLTELAAFQLGTFTLDDSTVQYLERNSTDKTSRHDSTIATQEITIMLISHDLFASLLSFDYRGIMPNSELIFEIEVLSFK